MAGWRGEPDCVALRKLKLTAVVVMVAQLPSFVDWFGWCTWDAFYTDVTTEGVKQGLKR